MANLQDIDKAYVSPEDKMLFQFDKDHPQSASQKQEMQKHQRIALRRDNPVPAIDELQVWFEE